MSRNSRGSALLIVLGMLSFMVISAVAFSIFMRQGRLPSSFLRQRILARQLVKAALAQAMSDLDEAIGDAKYPSSAFTSSSNRNYWRNRVFMGVSNPDGPYGDDALKNTVSTFPLEGLAYIPPPLVNTVRYWARRSPTATWSVLDYDAGRWAYTAVNVSDYLDINSLKANVMRDACPEHRLSIGYLFEDSETHKSWGAVTPSKFDAAMEKMRSSTYGSLVSLADYNLALSKDAGGALADIGFKSPFCEFVKSPPSGAEFYLDLEQARQQKFVTDSWFPGTNVTALVLTDYEKPTFEQSGGKGIRDIGPGLFPLMKDESGCPSPIFLKIKPHLNLAERAALRDYVDVDNVPSSLALPTLERAPMLTGLFVQPMNFQPKIEEMENPVPEKPYQNDAKKRATYRGWQLKGFSENPQVTVKGSAIYPFKRSSTDPDGAFKVQVLVKAYLVEKTRDFSKTRVDKAADACPYRPLSKNDWKEMNTLGATDGAYLSFFGEADVKPKSSRLTEDKTLIDFGPVILKGDGGLSSFARPLYGWRTVEVTEDGENWTTSTDLSGYDLKYFDGKGGQATFYYRKADGTTEAVTGQDNRELRWQFFVWTRIVDADGNTVDMFPATMRDDDVYNKINADAAAIATGLGDSAQDPIVPFAGPVAFTLTQGNFLGTNGGNDPAAASRPDPLTCYCNDPLFNWAPEDWWFVEQGTGVTAEEWKSKTEPQRNGHDLFRFVSNQGFLQSMGELQFLPLVRKDYNDFTLNNPVAKGIFKNMGSQYDGSRKTGPGAAVNQDCMWKTRFAFGPEADWEAGDEHDAYNWGIVDADGGAAVNPYADGDLFMAALANTPYDYSVAAEQEEDDSKLEDLIDLCFNARSTEATITWEQLQRIAEKMQARFRDPDELPWEEWPEWEETSTFFGQKIANFDDVDRKFLFSYWKPCFANRQQLFLIFVRAEPTVIGGASMRHTPSQLGARAVALVWREPVSSVSGTTGASGEKGANTSSSSSTPPHRMRVLFYHQFD